jgi:hypothetical protein
VDPGVQEEMLQIESIAIPVLDLESPRTEHRQKIGLVAAFLLLSAIDRPGSF